MSVVIAVSACLASSVAYAVAAVLQESYALHSVHDLLVDRRWWVAISFNGLGGLLHVVALLFGPLSLVQPFGVFTLVVAVGLASAIARRPVSRGEGRSMILTVVGLLGLLGLTASDAPIITLTTAELVILLAITAVALSTLDTVSNLRGASGLWAAAAAGISFGVCSALTQTITVRATSDGPASLTRPSAVLAAVAIAVLIPAGLLFTQRSYRNGLGGPMAVSTIVNPITAAAIGQSLLDERLAAGAVGVMLALISATCAAIGVNGLTHLRSPATTRL
jgi:hypothetical protein